MYILSAVGKRPRWLTLATARCWIIWKARYWSYYRYSDDPPSPRSGPRACASARQGDRRLAGVRIWAPHAEQNLFSSTGALASPALVEQLRCSPGPLLHIRNSGSDRYSERLRPYEIRGLGSSGDPTPGHTPGSISLLAEIDGRKVAFTGDCIAGTG